MRLHLGVLAAVAAVAALAGCAHHDSTLPGQQEFVTVEPVDVTPEPQKITRYADENRDGQVTRDEAKADPALAASFDQYDLDRNGKLDRGEFARLEDARRMRSATTVSSEQVSRRWLVEKPGGYFGPERRESLNRSGGWQEPSPETE